jgi:hypothetical protein
VKIHQSAAFYKLNLRPSEATIKTPHGNFVRQVTSETVAIKPHSGC